MRGTRRPVIGLPFRLSLISMRIDTGIRTWTWETKNKLRRTLTHLGRRLTGRQRIIASLTSYPPRMNTIHLAIRSILAQRTLPDKVVLWLYEGDFPHREADLPDTLMHLVGHDVVIRWVGENLKPHKKYYWALQEFTKDLVITFDDDLVYPNTYISELMEAHRNHPEAVVAVRTHLMMFNEDGTLKPYDQWVYEAPARYPSMLGRPSMRLFATSGAGTLFPPNIMPPETFDMEAICATSLNADDVWLKVMQVVGGVPVVSATVNQVIANIPLAQAREQNRLAYVPDTQEEALCHVNTEAGGNDVILADVLAYPAVESALGGRFDELVRDDDFDGLLRAE